ncbi:MAG: acyl-CoA dehydrogenase family protein [Rhizobiaceae bacterium]|nr:acyl-CoA dehydrogenase family protein [Rhizobiaceae bacterium]
MNLDFSSEEVQFRAEVRDWLRANAPREKRPIWDPQAMRAFDAEWQRRQYEGGWAGISWPREYGGRGLSTIQQLIWYEEYASAGAPVSSTFWIGLNHGGPTLIANGSDDQKTFHLPKILKGEAAWCQGFSEPNAGSDLASLKTRAVIDGDHLVVNGQKIWTSFAHIAEYQELLVRTDASGPKHKGITWVICDMRTPGISVKPIWNMAGTRNINQVFYDDVRIPLSNVVGKVDDGWRVALSTLSFERGTAFLANQLELSRAVDELIDHARVTPGPDGRRPAIADDEIAGKLAQLRAEVTALRAMTYRSISIVERNGGPGAEGSIIRLYHGELIQKVYRVAMELLGPRSLELEISHDDPVWGYLDSFWHTIAGGTAEVQRNIIGERVLGLPKAR